jgi:hypothetical protein
MVDPQHEFAALMEPVAEILLGDHNEKLSKKKGERRYGSRGSTSVDLKKGVWFDHESNIGGDVLDLINRHKGLSREAAITWLEDQGLKPKPNGKLGEIEKVYPYRDEAGVVLFEAVRFRPKDFRQRRPDPSKPGKHIWNVEGVRQVPYRLPEVREAIKLGRTIAIVEGEKDADNLWRIGIAASCNAGGANKWKAALNEYFKGADVVIIPDHDPPTRDKQTNEPRFHPDGQLIIPGRDHARDVARNLSGVAARVRVLDLAKVWTGIPEKADISDFLQQGITREALELLIANAPDYVKPAEKPQSLILSSAQFVAGFVPPDYVVGGILQRRFLYSLTGKTGAGKSAILLLVCAHVGGEGKPIGDREVERGRVLYLAGENPDDIRMRWIAMGQQMGFDVDKIDVHFIPGVFKFSEMFERIRSEIDRIGEVSLIIIDTSAAYFEGDAENDNVQFGNHARRMRIFTTMPGAPCVVAACHPAKNASDDNLIPRGGGAFLAEVDGNLTARVRDGSIEVSTQGKFRGPDFAPLSFQLRTVTHERLKDSKGRLIPTVVASPLSEQAQEDLARVTRSREDELLVALLDPANETVSQVELARRLGWAMKDGKPYHVQVGRILKALEKDKLVTSKRGRNVLTKDGKEEAIKKKPTSATATASTPKSAFHIIGPTDEACEHCHGLDPARDGDRIYRIRDPFLGTASHALHEACASEFYHREG